MFHLNPLNVRWWCSMFPPRETPFITHSFSINIYLLLISANWSGSAFHKIEANKRITSPPQGFIKKIWLFLLLFSWNGNNISAVGIISCVLLKSVHKENVKVSMGTKQKWICLNNRQNICTACIVQRVIAHAFIYVLYIKYVHISYTFKICINDIDVHLGWLVWSILFNQK